MADFLGDLCHHGVDGVLIGNVADVAVRLDACLCIGSQTLVHQLLLDIIEHDGSAVGCHSLCNCHADAVGCAGDQRHLAGQVKRFGSALCHNKVLLSKNHILHGAKPHRAALQSASYPAVPERALTCIPV